MENVTRTPVLYAHPNSAQQLYVRGGINRNMKAVLTDARESGASAFAILRRKDMAQFTDVPELVLHEDTPRAREQVRRAAKKRVALVITSTATSAARARQQMRAFMVQAREQKVAAIVFLVVDDALFDAMWGECEDAPQDVKRLIPLERAAQRRGASEEDVPIAPEWEAVFERFPVPPSLEAAYLGDATSVRRVRFMTMVAASCDKSVLITGESGTGKEIVAMEVHQRSHRRDGAFVVVNCANLQDATFESEMFGHVKGAFTGAISDRRGAFRTAHRGTLFLDEIGELSLVGQAKLLRAIVSRKIKVTGTDDETTVDVRATAATNQPLALMVEQGRFRLDLFQRLCEIEVRTPALRSHSADIPMLIDAFWSEMSTSAGVSAPPPFSEEAIAELQSRQWLGNVRELKRCLDRLFTVFGAAPIGMVQVDAVFLSDEEEVVGLGATRRDFSDLMDRCKLHVFETIEVIRKSQLTMRDIMSDRMVTPDPVTLARIAIFSRNRVAELERLCVHPALYYYTKAYEATRHYKRVLRTFANRLVTEPGTALRLWRDDAKPGAEAWKEQCEAASERAIHLLLATLRKLERQSQSRRFRQN